MTTVASTLPNKAWVSSQGWRPKNRARSAAAKLSSQAKGTLSGSSIFKTPKPVNSIGISTRGASKAAVSIGEAKRSRNGSNSRRSGLGERDSRARTSSSSAPI